MAGALKAKALYLGLYDYPYCGQAYVLNGGKFEKYDLSDAEIDMLYWYLHILKGNEWHPWDPSSYTYDEIKEGSERILAGFSHIVVCDDGAFELIRLKWHEDEKALSIWLPK